MSADLLREAAAAMRRRAEAANKTTGVWFDKGDIAEAIENAGLWDTGDDPWADAEHIVSWPPAVALAVADLLNASADRMDNRPAFPLTPVGATAAHVARVFLGRES